MKQYLFLFLAIVFEIIGTTHLKSSEQFTKLIPTIIAIVGYTGALYFLGLSLKSIPVGIAYAIWSGVGIVFVALIGWVFFKQHLDFPAILGLSLIVLGVITINFFSKTLPH